MSATRPGPTAAQLRAEAAAEYRHAASWTASANYADSYQARARDEANARAHEARARVLEAHAAALESVGEATMDTAWPDALERRP